MPRHFADLPPPAAQESAAHHLIGDALSGLGNQRAEDMTSVSGKSNDLKLLHRTSVTEQAA
jgi:hypothetical protein